MSIDPWNHEMRRQAASVCQTTGGMVLIARPPLAAIATHPGMTKIELATAIALCRDMLSQAEAMLDVQASRQFNVEPGSFIELVQQASAAIRDGGDKPK